MVHFIADTEQHWHSFKVMFLASGWMIFSPCSSVLDFTNAWGIYLVPYYVHQEVANIVCCLVLGSWPVKPKHWAERCQFFVSSSLWGTPFKWYSHLLQHQYINIYKCSFKVIVLLSVLTWAAKLSSTKSSFIKNGTQFYTQYIKYIITLYEWIIVLCYQSCDNIISLSVNIHSYKYE